MQKRLARHVGCGESCRFEHGASEVARPVRREADQSRELDEFRVFRYGEQAGIRPLRDRAHESARHALARGFRIRDHGSYERHGSDARGQRRQGGECSDQGAVPQYGHLGARQFFGRFRPHRLRMRDPICDTLKLLDREFGLADSSDADLFGFIRSSEGVHGSGPVKKSKRRTWNFSSFDGRIAEKRWRQASDEVGLK
jgi:hypothetical protein